MPETLTLTYRELLVGLVLASVIYLLETLLFSRRRKSPPPPLAEPVDAMRLQALEREVSTLKLRLELLEKNQARVETPEEREIERDANLHIEAVRLARQGVSSPEITERLGIARAEADLIVALQRADT